MKNYICINGNKTELTPEQLKQLGIELPKANPFERTEKYTTYYSIDTAGVVRDCNERNDGVDNMFYSIGNYCTDKSLMEQRALHETLNRLLWRYSMEHDGDKIDWENTNQCKYYIAFDHVSEKCYVDGMYTDSVVGTVCFNTCDITQNAIEKIVKPFMKAHPDFRFNAI